MAARAGEANADFKINPVPNLTGVFGQIRKQHDLSDSDEDGSIIDEDDVMEQNQNNDSASIDDEDEESS